MKSLSVELKFAICTTRCACIQGTQGYIRNNTGKLLSFLLFHRILRNLTHLSLEITTIPSSRNLPYIILFFK